ncbi:MAG: sugar phosphate isomerase/epimerase family protein [Planctomycetota bacterium]|jgi:sugar phosphate isomerase/epimerase
MDWREALTGTPDGLALAEKLGISIIELRTEHHDNQYLSTVLKKISKCGLSPIFRKSILNPGFQRNCIKDYFDFYYACLLNNIKNPLVIIHGTEDKNLYPVEHRQATGEMINILTRRFQNIEFSLENSTRKRGMSKACDTYYSTLKTLNRCKYGKVGICWDLGHSYFNYKYWKKDFIPPKEFLLRINNVHINDVVKNETHYPLQEGQVPIDEVISALSDIDYQGALTFEVLPERIKCGNKFGPMLLDMVKNITSLINKYSSRKSSFSTIEAS